MRRLLRQTFRAAAVPAAQLLLLLNLDLACHDSGSAIEPPPPPNFGISGVSVSPVGATLSVGDSVRFRAVVSLPATLRGRDTSVTWLSTQPGVATVDSSGKVTARGTGLASVTATLRIDSNFKAGAQITVTEASK